MKRIVTWLIKIAISALLMGILLNRFGIAKVADVMGQGRAIDTGLAILILFVSHVLGSVQWWILLRNDGIAIPWRQSFSFYFVGLFFNNFLISQVGGDMFRMVDVKRYSQKGASAVSSVFVDRMLGLLVMSSMTILATPWLFFQESINRRFLIPVGLLVAGWFFILFLLLNKKAARPFARMLDRVPGRLVFRGRDVYHNIHRFGNRGKWLLWPVTLAFGVQFLRILTHYYLGLAVGIQVPLIYYFMFIPVIAIMASLPVSLGGLGMREQTGVVLFGLVGVVAVQATAMELMAYIISVFTTIPGGMIFVFRKNIAPALSASKSDMGCQEVL